MSILSMLSSAKRKVITLKARLKLQRLNPITIKSSAKDLKEEAQNLLHGVMMMTRYDQIKVFGIC